MIPNQINIGGHNYITLKTDVINNNHDYLGFYNSATKTIEVANNQAESSKEQSFSHELIHCLLCETGAHDFLEQKEIDKEALPTMLENMFWRFLKDNTNFFHDNNKEEDFFGCCIGHVTDPENLQVEPNFTVKCMKCGTRHPMYIRNSVTMEGEDCEINEKYINHIEAENKRIAKFKKEGRAGK